MVPFGIANVVHACSSTIGVRPNTSRHNACIAVNWSGSRVTACHVMPSIRMDSLLRVVRGLGVAPVYAGLVRGSVAGPGGTSNSVALRISPEPPGPATEGCRAAGDRRHIRVCRDRLDRLPPSGDFVDDSSD